MSNQIWSWVVTIIGVIGFFLSGKKIWWAWYVNIANQVLWAVFAIVTEQWGFLIGIPLYLSVFIKNAYQWTKEHRDPLYGFEFNEVAISNAVSLDYIQWRKEQGLSD